MINKSAILSTLGVLALGASAQAWLLPENDERTLVDVTQNITENTTWSNENSYYLDRVIFVEPGATLEIEPGTIIYGDRNPDNGTYGSLVIARGAKIMAEGTKEDPIQFTAYEENISGYPGLAEGSNQFWGGLVILGNAVLNDEGNTIIDPDSTEIPTRTIEGFPPGDNTDLITYGGDNDEDNSGVLRYVSIRFGGFEFAEDEEINGLTLGAVGSGTTIEYIEVFNNSDDGVEFFGGTVNTKHMVMAFNEDESFDWDQGFRGMGQFWFAIQKSAGVGSNYTFETDGGDSPNKTLMPYAIPTLSNVTVIGAGSDNGQDNDAFRMKDNTGGKIYNSVFYDLGTYFIRIDDAETASRYTAGDIEFANNTAYMVANYDEGTGLNSLVRPNEDSDATAAAQAIVATLDYEDPMFGGVSRENGSMGLDPLPMSGSPLLGASTTELSDDFFMNVDYRGAFSASDNWIKGWTYLDAMGFLADSGSSEFWTITETSGDFFRVHIGWLYGEGPWYYSYSVNGGDWVYLWTEAETDAGDYYFYAYSTGTWLYSSSRWGASLYDYASNQWLTNVDE